MAVHILNNISFSYGRLRHYAITKRILLLHRMKAREQALSDIADNISETIVDKKISKNKKKILVISYKVLSSDLSDKLNNELIKLLK